MFYFNLIKFGYSNKIEMQRIVGLSLLMWYFDVYHRDKE